MIVGVQTWELHLPGCQSLKDKRSVLKPLTAGLRRQLNVSVAETGHQDLWQRAELTCCVAASDRAHAEAVLDSADRFVAAEPRGRIIDSYRRFF